MMHLYASSLAGTVGLLFFFTLFLAALVYAFWPSNKQTFEHMARLPIDEDEGDKW
ncbi:MAG: cbb3-type cytochrome c oxidase subunit 3 [Parvibaculum sp.]|nr:cbb3-type cytochrome c oxidase subunit 3 [Parvibaculum sp.]